MATMSSFFVKNPTQFNTLPKTHKKTHFTSSSSSSSSPSILRFSQSSVSRTRSGGGGRVSCGLITPDGGRLVELFIEESEKESKRKEALSLPSIKLSTIDLQWVHVLSEGWASPLKGFMRESEFLQTLHFNSLRLRDGSVVNMSVPIVLDIDESQKQRIGGANSVALFDDQNKPIAIGW